MPRTSYYEPTLSFGVVMPKSLAAQIDAVRQADRMPRSTWLTRAARIVLEQQQQQQQQRRKKGKGRKEEPDAVKLLVEANKPAASVPMQNQHPTTGEYGGDIVLHG
jgi:hypothetical protein